MATTLESVVVKYLRSGNPAQRTREEYSTTLRKWTRWGGAVPLEKLGRKEIRDFLDWVNEDAKARQARNPGRTSNKVRSHFASCTVVGVGARSRQRTSQVSEIEAAARCCRQALSDEARDECPLLRDARYETSAGLESSLSGRSLLARRSCRLLQLRSRHWDHLEDVAVSRTSSLAARVLGTALAGPRD